MINAKHFLKPTAMLAMTALLGCGAGSGSGGTGTSQYVPDSQLFMNSSPNATLAVLRLDPNTGTVVSEQTTLTAPNTLSGGALAGTVSYTYDQGASNSIALNSGGDAVLIDRALEHAFRFGASGGRVGVAGIATTNMPTIGSATYTGFADVNVNDGSGSPKSLTNATTTVSFDTGKVNVYLSSSQNWIRIDGADISGNTYSDGVLTVSPSFATDPVTSGALDHKGQFFDTDASELGGVFILDRTDAGVSFKAQGVYGGRDGS